MSRQPTQGRAVANRFLAALAFGDYQTLWTASFFAGAAAWALIVARGWIVYEFSDSSLWVGVVTFAAMIPRLLVSPFTGYLCDRFDRRNVLRAMFALNLVHNLILGFLIWSGYAEIWHLIVLSFVNGSARAAQMPAGQSLIPNLVPRKYLLNAIALNQATMHGSRLLGPMAIIPLMATTGAAGAIFLCAGFYAISLIQALRLRTESTGEVDARLNFFRNFAAGAVYVYRTPILLAIVVMAIFHCGLTMSFESLLPVMSTNLLASVGEDSGFIISLAGLLNESGAGFSLLMMCVGGGALISLIGLAGVNSDVVKGRLFFIVGIVSGLAPVALGLAPNLIIALICTVLMGMSQAAFMTLTHTMIQMIVPDGVRGRVAGIYSVHIGGMMATANLLNGALADFIDARMLLIAAGLVFVLVVVASWQFVTMRLIYRGGVARYAPASAV